MNIPDTLQQHGVLTKIERTKWLQMDCPQCGNNAQKFHLGYNLEGNYFNCWQCGYLPAAKTLQELTGISYKKAASITKDSSGVKESETDKRINRGRLVEPKNLGELESAHINYLKKRKFDPKEIESVWKIKGLGIRGGLLSWRIYIPFIFQGKIVSWTTRSISENTSLRYISASPEQEILNHKKYLYGEDFCKHTIIVCEGPTDAWCIGRGAVATCGVGYSPAQLLRMSKFPVRVICFDSSNTAQKRALDLVDKLSVFPGETFNVCLKADDPGSASRKEINEIRKYFKL